MKVRQYIIASLILHAVLVIASFSVLYREVAGPFPRDFMPVFVEESYTNGFFCNLLHNKSKSPSKMEEESQKLIAPKSLLSSPGPTDYDISGSQKENQGEREIQDFGISANVGESRSKTGEEGGMNIVSNSARESSGSQTVQTVRNHQVMIEEMPAPEVRTLSFRNSQSQDFRGDDFYRAIRSSLERAKSYPLLARKRGMEGTVLVSFTIDKKGSAQDVKIMKSSGYEILDEEVRKMLRKASPFPDLKGEIKIPITFKLGDSISNSNR